MRRHGPLRTILMLLLIALGVGKCARAVTYIEDAPSQRPAVEVNR